LPSLLISEPIYANQDVNDREKDAMELTNLLASFPHALINLMYACLSDALVWMSRD
jgi:hypothetical protein